MTLLERYRFFRERNAAPLAYYFARLYHTQLFCDDRNPRPQRYTVPTFLAVWNCTGGRG